MGIKESRIPAALQANRDRLEEMGVKLDSDGRVSDDAFQGGESSAAPSVIPDAGDPLTGPGKVTKTVTVFGKLDEEPTEDAPEFPAVPEDDSTVPPAEPLTGLAKREADAREAQRQMSKTQEKLNETEARIATMKTGLEQQFALLSEQIERLSALQVSVGDVPADLNPAADDVVARWQKDYDEALSVIDARVAPLYRIVKGLESAIQGLIKFQGQTIADARSASTMNAIYEAIPEETARRVANSQEFREWYLSQEDPEYKATIRKAVEDTSNCHPKTFLRVFQDFSRETGIDIGLKARPAVEQRQTPPPPVDTYPSLRAGGAPSRGVRISQAPDATVPLSVEELAQFHTNIARGTEEEKALLRKRMAITQIQIDGQRGQSLR